jgi:hypothetical protein
MNKKIFTIIFLAVSYSNFLFSIPDGIYYSDGIQKPDIYFDIEFFDSYEQYLKVTSSHGDGVDRIKNKFFRSHPFLPSKKVVDSEKILIFSTNEKDEKIILFTKFEDFGIFGSFKPIKFLVKINAENNDEIVIGQDKIKIFLYENNKQNKVRIKIDQFLYGDFYSVKIKDFVFIERIDDEKSQKIKEMKNYTYLENESNEIKEMMKMKMPIYKINKILSESGSIDMKLEYINSFYH